VSRLRVLIGDCREKMRELDEESVQCVVTSPPYFGLRDYGVEGQLGLEETPDEFVANLIEVFREVRRVLKKDGTVWVNLGDTWSHSGSGPRDPERWPKQSRNDHMPRKRRAIPGFPKKCLLMIPARFAIAMVADGWILRSEIIWEKPNPMVGGVKDRPTYAHEQVFLFSKRPRYYYDADALRTKQKTRGERHEGRSGYRAEHPSRIRHGIATRMLHPLGANARTVWRIATERARDGSKHFATFPKKLAERCIRAGTREGDMVLDPFAGTGRTGHVAVSLRRDATLIELSAEYGEEIEEGARGLQIEAF